MSDINKLFLNIPYMVKIREKDQISLLALNGNSTYAVRLNAILELLAIEKDVVPLEQDVQSRIDELQKSIDALWRKVNNLEVILGAED